MPTGTIPEFDLESAAAEILSLHGTGRQIAPLSQTLEHFDLEQAYRLSAVVTLLRQQRGERPVGRKIGFTNRLMWDAFGVRAPMWAPVYDTTTRDLDALTAPVPLAGLPEPKLEPEIVFSLARAPSPGLDEAGLFACLDWVAFGFELVQSIFPGWRFAAADTVAGFGLHARLYIGERHDPNSAPERWLRELATFGVELTCNDRSVAHGEADYVLGGPLTALRHLNDLLQSEPAAPQLRAGEVITTGTLTLAASVAAGERWEAIPSGIGLAPVEISFA